MKAAAVFLAALSTHVLGEDIEESSGGIAVKFSGKSGKFTLYSKAAGPGDKNALTFQVDSFREYDENGQKVASSHQFENLAQTEFTFETKKDMMVNNATAAKVSFKSTMNDLGDFWVDTYLFEKEGVVSPAIDDPESAKWGVGPGDVKFNIGLENWKWCGSGTETCGNKIGHYIEIDMEIKTKAGHKATGKGGKGGGVGPKASQALDLGGGIPLDFTPELMVDGVADLMPEDYPKYEQKGSKQIITFYFKKFADNATYDPLVGGSDSESLVVDDVPDNGTEPPAENPDDDSSPPSSRPLLGIVGLIVLLAGALH